MKPKSRLHLFCDDLNKFFLKPETKSKDEEVGAPSCGKINQHQVQWCPPSPHPQKQAFPTAHSPDLPSSSEYVSELQYSFLSKTGLKNKKNIPACTIFLLSRAACGEIGFKSASLIMGHKDSTCSWLEGAPLCSKTPLSAPLPTHTHPAVFLHLLPVTESWWGGQKPEG